ncbi:hypothetical protein BGW42_005417 [Actinomortierella wolfii]|nr:hypothetical protein BGW42_005417 [Actinomortierella wolfii]
MAKINEIAPSLSEPCQLLGSRTPLQLVAISNVKLNNEIFSNRSLSIHKRILVKNFLTLLYQLNPIEWIEESPIDEQDGWMEQTLNAAGLGDSSSSDQYTSSSTNAGPSNNEQGHNPRSSSLPADSRRNETKRRSFSTSAPLLPPFPFSSSQSSNASSSSTDRLQSSMPRPTSTELPQSLHSYLAAVFDVNWTVDLPSREDSWFTQPSASSSGLNDQPLPRSLLSSSSTDSTRSSRQDSTADTGLLRSTSRGQSTSQPVVPLARKSSLQYSNHSSQQQQQAQQQQQQTTAAPGTPATPQSHQPANRPTPTRTKPTLVPGRRSSLMHAGTYSPAVPQKSPEAKAVDTTSHASTQSLTVATNSNSGSTTATPAKSPKGPTPVYTRRTSSLPSERTKVSPRMPSNDRPTESVNDNNTIPPSGLPRPLIAPSAPAASSANSLESKTSLGAKTRRQVSGELDLKGAHQPPSSPPQQTFTRGASTLSPQAPRQFTISSPPSSPSFEEDSSPIFSPTPTFHSSSKKTSPALPSPSPSPPLLLPNIHSESELTYEEETSHLSTPSRPYAYTRSTSDDDIFQSRPALLTEPRKTYLPSSKSSPSLVSDSGLASEERPLPPLPSHVQGSIRPSLVEYHQYHELQKQFLTDERQAPQQEVTGSLVSSLGLGKLLARSNSKSISISAPFLLADKDTGRPLPGALPSSQPPSSGQSGTTTSKSRARNTMSMLKGTFSSVKSGLVRSSSQILPSAATTVAAAAVVMQSASSSPSSASRYSHQPPQILGISSSGTVSSLSTASYSSTSSNASNSSSSSSSSASPPLLPNITTTTAYSSAPAPLQQQSYQDQTLQSGWSTRDTQKTSSIYSTMSTSSVYSSFPQPPAPTHYSPHSGTQAYSGLTGGSTTPATVSLATGGYESTSSTISSSPSNSPRWNSMKSMFGLRVASQEAS